MAGYPCHLSSTHHAACRQERRVDLITQFLAATPAPPYYPFPRGNICVCVFLSLCVCVAVSLSLSLSLSFSQYVSHSRIARCVSCSRLAAFCEIGAMNSPTRSLHRRARLVSPVCAYRAATCMFVYFFCIYIFLYTRIYTRMGVVRYYLMNTKLLNLLNY